MAFLINPDTNAPILSPDAVARHRQVADAYLNASRDTAPIQSWTQGAAKLVDALVGGLTERKADAAEQAGQQQASSAMNKLVAALSGTSVPDASPDPSMASTMPPATMGAGPTQTMATPSGTGAAPDASADPPMPRVAAGAGNGSGSQGDLASILTLAQNPWLSSSQDGIVNLALKRKLDADQPTKPIYEQMNGHLLSVAGGTATDITPPGLSGGGFRPATPDEIKQYGLPDGTPAQVNQATNQLSVLGGSGLGGGTVSDEDTKAVADGFRTGKLPPNISGRPTRYTIAILADLAKPSPEFPQGFDLSKANEDWQATAKYLATQNGPQMLTLRNAIGQVDQSVDILSQLNDQWQAGNYPPLNSIRGDLAKLGALGPEAQSIYTQMAAQVADVTAEMGSVLMKGNAPTDHGLDLASKNLDLNSPYATFVDSLAQLKENISYKKNSMSLGPAGVSGDNAYLSGITPPVAVDPNALPPSNVTNPASAVPPGPPVGSAPAPSQPAYREGQTATGPNGTKMLFTNGKWLMVQ